MLMRKTCIASWKKILISKKLMKKKSENSKKTMPNRFKMRKKLRLNNSMRRKGIESLVEIQLMLKVALMYVIVMKKAGFMSKLCIEQRINMEMWESELIDMPWHALSIWTSLKIVQHILRNLSIVCKFTRFKSSQKINLLTTKGELTTKKVCKTFILLIIWCLTATNPKW